MSPLNAGSKPSYLIYSSNSSIDPCFKQSWRATKLMMDPVSSSDEHKGALVLGEDIKAMSLTVIIGPLYTFKVNVNY